MELSRGQAPLWTQWRSEPKGNQRGCHGECHVPVPSRQCHVPVPSRPPVGNATCLSPVSRPRPPLGTGTCVVRAVIGDRHMCSSRNNLAFNALDLLVVYLSPLGVAGYENHQVELPIAAAFYLFWPCISLGVIRLGIGTSTLLLAPRSLISKTLHNAAYSALLHGIARALAGTRGHTPSTMPNTTPWRSRVRRRISARASSAASYTQPSADNASFAVFRRRPRTLS